MPKAVLKEGALQGSAKGSSEGITCAAPCETTCNTPSEGKPVKKTKIHQEIRIKKSC